MFLPPPIHFDSLSRGIKAKGLRDSGSLTSFWSKNFHPGLFLVTKYLGYVPKCAAGAKFLGVAEPEQISEVIPKIYELSQTSLSRG